ncbi:MAG: FAD-binding oxidoreductase [Candidatus Latescibacteria bacterium]|nr:FAD-binding oxidoreductase [Candidatus Latescibacterota bacterium]
MPLDDTVISRLAGVVGEPHIRPGGTADAVDGATPTAVVTPGTAEEIAEVLRIANAEHFNVIPCGGRTMLALGRPPDRCDVLLSTRRLQHLLHHSPADLVATVETGLTLETLQADLGKNNQILPLDPPYAQSATIGGVLSANTSGPKRLLYGGVRDYLLGTRVVRPTGEIVKAGGIVVKNVTGYDMNKLYIGALGTLGIVVEATFKLHPIPETEETLLATCPSHDTASACVEAIRNSQLLPAAMTVIDPEAHTQIADGRVKTSYLFALCAEGVEPIVVRHRSLGTDLLREAGAHDIIVLDAETSAPFWEQIRRLPCAEMAVDGGICSATCRSVLPVARGQDLFPLVHRIARENGVKVLTLFHAGHGIGYVRLLTDPDGLALDHLVRAVVVLREEIVRREGHLIVESAPLLFKRKVDVWGKMDSRDLVLMRMLRTRFDPRSIVNPVRFVV